MSDQPDQPDKAPIDPADLDDALDALEHMLHRGGSEDAEGDGLAEAADGDAQLDIPLLNDVVDPRAGHPDAAGPHRNVISVAEHEACQRLIKRLASEIEVLVQTGVEQALKSASRDITRKVRDHLEIMLPEILDEIAEAKRDRGGG